MQYKITIILGLLVLFACVGCASAQNTSSINAGFVSGTWFSKSVFFAKQEIRVYTAIQNQSGFDITGKVEFYDNQTPIGSSEFSAISNRLIEVWTDWTPAYGNHEIYAKIIEVKKSETGQDIESIILPSDISAKYKIFVDEDTDKDNIGNKDDIDDDNDGVSDTEEISQGSNPLVEDSKPNDIIAESAVINKTNPADEIDDSDYIFQKLKKRVNETMAQTSEKLAEFAKLKIEPAKERVKQKIEHETSTPKKATNYLWLAALGIADRALNSKAMLYLVLFIAILFLILFVTKLFKRFRN